MFDVANLLSMRLLLHASRTLRRSIPSLLFAFLLARLFLDYFPFTKHQTSSTFLQGKSLIYLLNLDIALLFGPLPID
jgi:hypothetical protein